MPRNLKVEPNVDVVTLVIILMYSSTHLPWLLRNDIELPEIVKNVEINIPLRYYPESQVQAFTYTTVIRYIYHILALFLAGNNTYMKQSFNKKCSKYLYVKYDASNMYIHIVINVLKVRHINALKVAACQTLLQSVKKRMSETHKTFSAYMALFNTLHHIAHNKPSYDTTVVYTFLSQKPNIPLSFLPIIANIMKHDSNLRHVTYRPKCSMILLYPMYRNIMSNNNFDVSKIRSTYLNLTDNIPIIQCIAKIELEIKKYRKHCNTLLGDLHNSTYDNWIENLSSDSIFL